MKFRNRVSLASALVVAVAIPGCGDNHDDEHHHHGLPDASVDSTDIPDAAHLTVAFAHLVDGTPIALGTTTPYVNAAGNEFGVTLVRYFISNIRLTYADASTWDAPAPRFVDHDVATTLSQDLGDAPAGTLTSISFVMGLPAAINVTGLFTQPPESLMEWPAHMGGGYHYMKFEGRYINTADEPFAFKAHAGPLAGTDYSFPVTLDATGRTLDGDTTLTLEMNLEEWFTGPNDWDLNDYFTSAHPGIMNNAAAQQSLEENGAGVFTLGQP